jgi:hypothetical protein
MRARTVHWVTGITMATAIAASIGWFSQGGRNSASGSAQLAFVSPAIAAGAGGDLFAPIAEVLNHPRCMNCHPRDDRPRQGEDRHVHLQNVVRGPDDLGFVNMRCTSCHRDENNLASGLPGAPTWHLAPLSMGWQGLNNADLCTALKDEKRNGGRTVAALIEHMDKDKLVLWGWDPGGTRAPVTTPHATFVTQLKAWAAANAPCPG